MTSEQLAEYITQVEAVSDSNFSLPEPNEIAKPRPDQLHGASSSSASAAVISSGAIPVDDQESVDNVISSADVIEEESPSVDALAPEVEAMNLSEDEATQQADSDSPTDRNPQEEEFNWLQILAETQSLGGASEDQS